MTVDSKLKIEGKNIEITEAIREYAEAKIARVYKHFDSIIKHNNIRVMLSVIKGSGESKHSQKAEITINITGGQVLRCEASEETIYAALDIATDKIEKQFRKYKTRVYSKVHHGKSVRDYGLDELGVESVPAEILEHAKSYKAPTIIKNKLFPMKPLDPERALELLEDSGHPFYMFLNIYSNKVACIYKRDDGQYGLIEPES